MSKIPKLPHYMDQPIHSKGRDKGKEMRGYSENWDAIFGNEPKVGSLEWEKANLGLIVIHSEKGYTKIGINPNGKKP